MRLTLWRRYASDAEESACGGGNESSEEVSSESAAHCALSLPATFKKPRNPKTGIVEPMFADEPVSQSNDSSYSSDGAVKPPKHMIAWTGSLVRGARGLMARVRWIKQSVEELKDRLFFDAEEAQLRSNEFDALIDALEEAADALEEDDFATRGFKLVENVQSTSAIVGQLWQNCDDLAERLRQRCAEFTLREPRSGFGADAGVRRVGANGDPALRGQFECVALRPIKRGQSAPYPGVVVGSLEEQRALLAPLRPVDRTKWACFSYSFSSHLNDNDEPPDFCTELWPSLNAPTAYVNDACGPVDRSAKRLAERQNVEYIETLGPTTADWRVDVRAIRDIAQGESLLADYGDAYWQNWKEHVHSRAMRRLEQRVADVYAIRVQQRSAHTDSRHRRTVRIETRIDAWLRGAKCMCNYLNGLPSLAADHDDNLKARQSARKRQSPRQGQQSSQPNIQNEQESQQQSLCPPAHSLARQASSASTTVAAPPLKPSETARRGASAPTNRAAQSRKRGRNSDAISARTTCWPVRADSWRNMIGRHVTLDESRRRGYGVQVGVAVRVATERDSFDPMLQALFETALAGPALFEAWWADGQPYPLLTLNPRPRTASDLWARDAYFDVNFIDGERAVVQRVAPILKPAVWKRLERLPIGAWCRPLHLKSNISDWGVVVNYTYYDGAFTYHVKLVRFYLVFYFEPNVARTGQ